MINWRFSSTSEPTNYETLLEKTQTNVMNWIDRKKSLLPNGERQVLDLDCANGIVSQWLQKQHPSYTFVGVDYSENIYTRIMCADLSYGLPKHIRNQSYNIVFATGCLEFIQNHDLLFDQMHSILKPGGMFLLTLQMHTPSTPSMVLDTPLKTYTQKQALALCLRRIFRTCIALEYTTS